MSSSSPSVIPSNALPPLLRLATELHLEIISYLPDVIDAEEVHDLAVLRLRATNRYFHKLTPGPTHHELLHLEHLSFVTAHPLYACRFCVRLRPKSNFALAKLSGKTGINGFSRWKRFCADCGFDTTFVGKSERYSPGARAVVCGTDWVWCILCRKVKKGEAARKVCVQMCHACYGIGGCKCGLRCGKTLVSQLGASYFLGR